MKLTMAFRNLVFPPGLIGVLKPSSPGDATNVTAIQSTEHTQRITS